MNVDELEYQQVLIRIEKEFPKFSVAQKADSAFMKVLSWLLFFNREFMTRYTTVIGYRVYVPARWMSLHPLVRATVMRHECVHMRQRHIYGYFLFSVLYLLIPFPVCFAWFRASFERAAYKESMVASLQYWGLGHFTAEHKKRWVKYFTSAAYGWMYVRKKTVEKWYDDTLQEVLEENP